MAGESATTRLSALRYMEYLFADRIAEGPDNFVRKLPREYADHTTLDPAYCRLLSDKPRSCS